MLDRNKVFLSRLNHLIILLAPKSPRFHYLLSLHPARYHNWVFISKDASQGTFSLSTLTLHAQSRFPRLIPSYDSFESAFIFFVWATLPFLWVIQIKAFCRLALFGLCLMLMLKLNLLLLGLWHFQLLWISQDRLIAWLLELCQHESCWSLSL